MKKTTRKPWVRVQLVRDNDSAEERSIESPQSAVDVARHLSDADREHLLVLHLSARNGLLGMETVSIGSLTAAIVSPREVFKAAILSNAASIILIHNHPSGAADPSREDHETTRRVLKAGDLLGIPLQDHIIIADGGYYSFREKGNLDGKTEWRANE